MRLPETNYKCIKQLFIYIPILELAGKHVLVGWF